MENQNQHNFYNNGGLLRSIQQNRIQTLFSDADAIEKAKAFQIGQTDKSGRNVKTLEGWKPIRTHGHLVKKDKDEKKERTDEDTIRTALRLINMNPTETTSLTKQLAEELGCTIGEAINKMAEYEDKKKKSEKDKMYSAVREWSGDHIKNEHIDSIIEAMKDADVDESDLKIKKTPNWSQEKESSAIDLKVKSIRRELREGMEHKDMKSRDIDDVLYGLVRYKNN